MHLDANLHGVGAELNPVIDEERHSSEGPDDGEEREVTELDDHFPKISGDVVDVEFSFFPDALEECRVFWRVVCGSRRRSAILCSPLRLDLLVLGEATTLEVWYNELHAKIDDLSSYGEVDDLLAKTIRVDTPAGVCMMELLLVFSERSHSYIKDVEMWYDDVAKGNIDKGCQEDAKVRHDEVHDEYFLGEGCVVCSCGLVVFKIRKSSSNLREESVKDRVDCCKDTGRDEDLENFSDVLF